MIAFEITEQDVIHAIKQGFDVVISEEKAIQALSLLDKQLISDQAAFHSDEDGDDDAMNEATDRACINIIWQIQREPKKFIPIFT